MSNDISIAAMTMNVANMSVRSQVFDRQFPVGRGRAEIGGDRADDADRVEIGQAGHVFDENDEQHRDDGGEQHAGARHAPFVEALEDRRQLAVARHEELDHDKIDNRGVDGGEEQQGEDDADDETEGMTERGPECAADKNFAHVTQHVVAHAFRPGR